MILYIGQTDLSFNDRFTVKNGYGMDTFSVEYDRISVGRKLTIKDVYHNQLAVVEQKVLSLLPRFSIEDIDKHTLIVKRVLDFFKKRYRIKGRNWTVSGDIPAHDYTIRKGSDTVAVVTKAWFTWGDSYEIDVTDDKDTVLALAVVLAVDAANTN